MKHVLLLSALAFTLCFFAATITTQAQAWTMIGGDYSCGSVTERKNDISHKEFKAWAFGFMSAVNDLTQTTWNNASDEQGIWQAILLECQKNPLENLYGATAKVWAEIMKRQ
jgi:hypothetical protein